MFFSKIKMIKDVCKKPVFKIIFKYLGFNIKVFKSRQPGG